MTVHDAQQALDWFWDGVMQNKGPGVPLSQEESDQLRALETQLAEAKNASAPKKAGRPVSPSKSYWPEP